MELAAEVCWRATLSHDRRFDGVFFIGVRTTRVYCRPICPVHPPKRVNVQFHPTAASAEEAGFRPCRRCRPETAPGTPAWLGSSATVSRALRLISEGPLDDDGVDRLAERLGIGARHLRRLFAQHLGASPASVARTRRVHFARRLVDETELPMAEVAASAGFRSVRQFNHSMRATFGRTPTELRRKTARSRGDAAEGELVLKLPYRLPFDWDAILEYLATRAIPGVEAVCDGAYHRSLETPAGAGFIRVTADPKAPQLALRIRGAEPRALIDVVERVRRLFDLNANPRHIAGDLGRDPRIAACVAAHPGLRVPGAWDPFELAVRAILGQQVSVKGATTLAGRLVQSFGLPLEAAGEHVTHLFPRPAVLAAADVSAIGLPRARAAAISSLAAALASGEVTLDSSRGLDDTVRLLARLPGIGEWTAQYIAMRALREPDAFPATDLGLRRALGNGAGPVSEKEVLAAAEAWRPWRAYAAVHLWTGGAAAPAPENTTERRRGHATAL